MIEGLDLTDACVSDFETVVRSEYAGLVATSRFLVGSSHVAEEVVQECLVRAYRRWADVGRMDRPGAWIRRIVLNASMSVLRRRRAEVLALARWQGRARTTHEDPDVDQFGPLLRGLPRKMAQALALRYGADLSVKGVAEQLEISDAAARTLLHRGRSRVREALGPDQSFGELSTCDEVSTR